MKVKQVSVTVDGYNLFAANKVVGDLNSTVVHCEFIHHLDDGLPNQFTFLLVFGEEGLTSDLEAIMRDFARSVSYHRP